MPATTVPQSERLLYRLDELEGLTGVPTATWRGLIKAKKLRVCKPGQRAKSHVYVRRQDLLDFLEASMKFGSATGD